MIVGNKHYRSIFLDDDSSAVKVIDQRQLPFNFEILTLRTADDVIWAIKEMVVRGAPLIGAIGGFGVWLALKDCLNSADLGVEFYKKVNELKWARPTAVNLQWAVDRQLNSIKNVPDWEEKLSILLKTASTICEEDISQNKEIGLHGLEIIKAIMKKKSLKQINILTHCNAGWLATVDYGTALAPIFLAHGEGIDVHVWVDETRPRNQGAKLTAWELMNEAIPHHLITDNAGGHLMQNGMVDMVIVGTDRTTLNGEVTNKIGTYLKALSAFDNNIPFYVAVPSSSIDFDFTEDFSKITIEERDADEVNYVDGFYDDEIVKVRIANEKTPSRNWAFDVTPARLVTGLITERGVCKADKNSILELFPEHI
jgi:methylthioribose-1-phosphate isomerase